MTSPAGSIWKRIEQAVASPSLARLGLICGTCALTAAAVGAVLYEFYLQPSGMRTELSERTQTRPDSSQPRLPRARPNEPVTTGSIGPDDLSGERGRFDAAEMQNIERLRTRAVLIAGSRPECDRVTGSELLENRPLDLVVVLVRCGNETRFYLDEADIRAAAAVIPPVGPAAPVLLTDSQAVSACEEKVRRGLPKPATLSRSLASTGIDRAPGGDAVVSFDFDALNGFGFPLALQAQCVFSEREIARLEVAPRSPASE